MNHILTALHDLDIFVQGMRFEKEANGVLPEIKIIPMMEEYTDFLRSLSFCKKTAVSEYEYVSGEIDRIRRIGDDICKIQNKTRRIKIQTIEMDQDQNAPDQKQTAEALQKTIDNYSHSLQESIGEIQKKTKQLKTNLSDFKIVLFGKTKSGKSTVREALTKGKGKSIGKGGQSTTVRIHEYQWYNLKVYDTPGTLSVRDTERDKSGIGKEESQAVDLLLKSDIALFMFTTDNIEKAELDYLREICERGKDVLILLNVKSDLSDYKKYKLRKKDREVSAEFQKGNIERIAEALGNRKPVIIPFHAQAAFFSRGDNRELKRFYRTYDVTRAELYELSRFGEIRNYLVQNIIERGAAIRSETIRECFISHVKHFFEENKLRIEQDRDSINRVLDLLQKTQKKTESIFSAFNGKLYSEINSELRARINTFDIAVRFVDFKYNGERVKRYWESLFTDELIKEISSTILQKLDQDISAEVEEMSRQLAFIMETDAHFEGFGGGSLPWEDILNIGGILTGIGSAIAFFFSGPVGWALAGASLLAWLIKIVGKLFGWLKSRETKISEMKEKLDKDFEQKIQTLTESLREHCQKSVFPAIQGKFVNAISVQKELLKICDEFLTLNQKFFEIAEDNRKKLAPHIKQLISEQKALLGRN